MQAGVVSMCLPAATSLLPNIGVCAPPPLQWFVLNRKHAELVLSDQAVERLFQLNCYTSLERANGKMWERVCYSGVACHQPLCALQCALQSALAMVLVVAGLWAAKASRTGCCWCKVRFD